jgi:hypothetical protein
MRPNGATCLPADCCFGELHVALLNRNPTKRVDLVQNKHYHHIEMQFVLAIM